MHPALENLCGSDKYCQLARDVKAGQLMAMLLGLVRSETMRTLYKMVGLGASP